MICLYLYTPVNLSRGREKARRPARTYIKQLCADRGCSLEDIPGSMDDWDGWRESVSEICASWWWWCLYLKIAGNFMCLIHQGGFWFVLILFRRVKLIFFCIIPCGLLSLPSRVQSLLFLSKFVAFTFCVIYHLSLSPHKLHLLYCCMLSIFAST